MRMKGTCNKPRQTRVLNDEKSWKANPQDYT